MKSLFCSLKELLWPAAQLNVTHFVASCVHSVQVGVVLLWQRLVALRPALWNRDLCAFLESVIWVQQQRFSDHGLHQHDTHHDTAFAPTDDIERWPRHRATRTATRLN